MNDNFYVATVKVLVNGPNATTALNRIRAAMDIAGVNDWGFAMSGDKRGFPREAELPGGYFELKKAAHDEQASFADAIKSGVKIPEGVPCLMDDYEKLFDAL